MNKNSEFPNILLIMTDQHSKNFIGAYGNNLVRTPNLDRLASEGMMFDNAYCASPLCVPSRMSFLTSQTPSTNEVWNNQHILHSSIPTWATLMSTAGYETALLGRMHFCGPDQRHGFEHRPIAERNAGLVGTAPKGGPFWTKFPGSTSGQSRPGVEIAGKGHTHYQWGDEERTRSAVKWLREKSSSDSTQPFAAVLGYTLPHCPYVAKPELFDYYYDKVDIPAIEKSQPESITRFREIRGILEPELPEERVRVARTAYYGLCEHIDSLIGQVLGVLDETGLSENTIVIYCSDHGEMAGEHGCWWKSNYYENSVGVPLMVRWPGTVTPGAKSDAVCNLMDIGPTLVEIAGNAFPYRVEGRSMLNMLKKGSDDQWVNETTSELADFRGGFLPSKMIRSGPWKMWVYGDYPDMPPALFNLDEDPEELNDLGGNPEHEVIRAYLLDRIFEGWNPDVVLKKSKQNVEYFDLLRKWGETVNPDSSDALVYPSDEYESDVELL